VIFGCCELTLCKNGERFGTAVALRSPSDQKGMQKGQIRSTSGKREVTVTQDRIIAPPGPRPAALHMENSRPQSPLGQPFNSQTGVGLGGLIPHEK
jgi:hypothetical protein